MNREYPTRKKGDSTTIEDKKREKGDETMIEDNKRVIVIVGR